MSVGFAVRGEVSEATIIERCLLEVEIDQVITYDQLSEALGRDFFDNRSPFYAARERVQREKKTTFVVETGVGYRRVAPNEHYSVGRGFAAKAGRAGRRGRRVVVNTDYNGLTEIERKSLEGLDERLRGLDEYNRRTTRQMNRLEKAVADNREESRADIAEVKEQMETLAENLRKLEEKKA